MSIDKTVNKLNSHWDEENPVKNLLTPLNSENHMMFSHNYIPTGIAMLDLALFGGIKVGHTTTITGKTNSSKTTVALNCCKQALIKEPDKYVIYVDTENLIDPLWVEKIIGEDILDSNRFYLVKPDFAEQAMDTTDHFMRENLASLIVIDSLATMSSVKEVSNPSEKENMALRARAVGKLCRKIVSLENWMQKKYGTAPTTLFLNQVISSMSLYGSPYETTAGYAAKYKSVDTIWLNCTKTHYYKDEVTQTDNPDYNEHEFSFKKDKNIYIPKGSYNLIRNPENPLGAGYIDDAEQLYLMCRYHGILANKGIEGLKENIGLKSDIVRELRTNELFKKLVTRKLIRMARKKKKMREFPPDKYLIIDDAFTIPRDNKSEEADEKELNNETEQGSEGKESKQSVQKKPRARKKSSK